MLVFCWKCKTKNSRKRTSHQAQEIIINICDEVRPVTVLLEININGTGDII
jgi:hypothetical protein